MHETPNFRTRSVFSKQRLQFAKDHEVARTFSRSLFQGVSGFHDIRSGVPRGWSQLTSRDCTVDRREVKNVSTGKSTIGSASATSQKPGVTELEQRIQAIMRECNALRVAATPVLHKEKPVGQQMVVLRWTAFHQCPTTCKMWKGG